MKQKLKLIFILMLLSLQCFSQKVKPPAITNPADEKEFKQNTFNTFTGINFTPFGTGALSNTLSNISLTSLLAKGESGKLELKYSGKNWTTAGLTITQEIGKNDKEATPFDVLDGLQSGTTVEFNFQKMIWKPVLNQSNFSQFDNAANAYAVRVNKNRRLVTLNDILSGKESSEVNYIKGIKLKQPVFFNFKAGFTKNSYSFATDSLTLAEQEEVHLTPTITAYLGLPLSLTSYISLGYSYSVSYEEADEISFISPFGTSSNAYTRKLAFGKPQKESGSRLNLEWRTNFMGKDNRVSFGIGPSVAYALSAKKLAFVMPVYFINSKDDDGKPTGLQGGIRFGYSTSTQKGQGSSFKEGFAAQLIVTAPFNIFGDL